jgi:hypothetical protein
MWPSSEVYVRGLGCCRMSFGAWGEKVGARRYQLAFRCKEEIHTLCLDPEAWPFCRSPLARSRLVLRPARAEYQQNSSLR